MKIDFNILVGSKAQLYKRTEINTFQLGNVVFEVLEDPSDGYRSMLGSVQILKEKTLSKEFLAEVTINESDEIFYLKDDEGFVWLEFGTGDYRDYYPYFIFQTHIKESIKDRINKKL